MKSKSVINAAAGATTAVSATILVIRQFVSWFGEAQTAGDLLGLIRESNANWDAIYLFLVAFGAGILIANNWAAISRWRRMRTERNTRRWDTTIADAISHIAYYSFFSNSLPKEDAIHLGVKAFVDAAKDGRIRTAGRLPDSGSLTPIKRHLWRDYKPEYSAHRESHYGEYRIRSFGLRDVKRSVVFEGIMVDYSEIQEIWPGSRANF